MWVGPAPDARVRLRAAEDGAAVDGMEVAQGRNAVPGAEGAGVLERRVGDRGRDNEQGWVRVAKRIVLVDGRYPPSLVGELLADALSLELGSGIIQAPPVYALFNLQGLVIEGIQLLDGSELAGAGSYEFVGLAGLRVLLEVEGDEVEVSASYPHRRRDSGGG